MQCHQIADQISRHMDALASVRRDLPPRHRSLSAVFEQSWALLNDHERQTLAILSLFRGGFTLAAAQAVAQASPQTIESLRHESLIRASGNNRYDLHEVIRQYAAVKLEEMSEIGQAAAVRFTNYFTEMIAEQSPLLFERETTTALAALLADLDNFRAAWKMAIHLPLPPALERAHAGLASLFIHQSYLAEGESAFAAAASLRHDEAQDPLPPGLRAHLLAARCQFLYALGRYPETIQLAAEARELAQAAGSNWAAGRAALCWGNALARLGDYENAKRQISEAEKLARQADRPHLQVDCLQSLGHIHVRRGEYDDGHETYQRTLTLSRSSGYRRGEAFALGGLGNVALVRERPL
jgi:tetratricopeptide (TPR) repeat protein